MIPDRFSELVQAGRYAAGLRGYFAHSLSGTESRERIIQERRRAPAAFLDALGRAVFANPRSPYLPLFQLARMSFADVERCVLDEGVDATLERLFAAGVHISLSEFKARRPILRPGLELHVRPEDRQPSGTRCVRHPSDRYASRPGGGRCAPRASPGRRTVSAGSELVEIHSATPGLRRAFSKSKPRSTPAP